MPLATAVAPTHIHSLSFPQLLHKEGEQYKMLSGYTSEYICCGLKRFVVCAKCDKTDLRVTQNKRHEKYEIRCDESGRIDDGK